jgi:hypothetical protein
MRQSEMVKRSVHHSEPFRQAAKPLPGPQLVHSNTSRQNTTLRPAFTVGPNTREGSSQYRKA